MTILTDLLSPAYILLSITAIISRYNPLLKTLAAHGKTTITSTSSSEQEAKPVTIAKKSSRFLWVSKRWFIHFYITGLLSVFLMGLIVVTNHDGGISGDTICCPAIILLTIHLIRRAYECLFVQQYRKQSSQMHLAGYALGMGHYLVLPLVFWNIHNSMDSEVTVTVKRHGATTVLGVLTVSNLWFQYEQYKHHVILASLRKHTSGGEIGDASQKLHTLPPNRRWFRWILCPHYLAEILIYFCFALMLQYHCGALAADRSHMRKPTSALLSVFDFGGTGFDELLVTGRRYRHWMLFLWVTSNLTISSFNTYDWYGTKLGMSSSDQRGAILPEFRLRKISSKVVEKES